MATCTGTPPEWYALSHQGRYKRFHKVRRDWCLRPSIENEDRRGRTVYLDGTWINDVPSFYLSLGEATNGPNGYFGAGLDALDDCLCGGFGVSRPLTIRLRHFDETRNALDGRAWCRWRAEGFREAIADGESTEQLVDWGYLGDGSEADIARWTATYEAALTGELFACDELGSYFDALLEVFEGRGVVLVPEKEEAR